MTKFSSPRGGECFEALSKAAKGFDNLSVLEAAAIMCAQAIASGSLDVSSAQGRARHLGHSMAADIATNWPLVTRQRARG